MAYPTDAELEEMAEKVLTVDRSFAELLPGHAEEICEEAAAMLRACKGGAVQKITVTQEMQERFAAWFRQNYPGPDTIIYKPDWHAPKIFRAALGAAPLSALEPAPDARQEAWRAGMEAAANAALAASYHDDRDGEIACDAICALAEKGPDHE